WRGPLPRRPLLRFIPRAFALPRRLGLGGGALRDDHARGAASPGAPRTGGFARGNRLRRRPELRAPRGRALRPLLLPVWNPCRSIALRGRRGRLPGDRGRPARATSG